MKGSSVAAAMSNVNRCRYNAVNVRHLFCNVDSNSLSYCHYILLDLKHPKISQKLLEMIFLSVNAGKEVDSSVTVRLTLRK